MSSKNPIRSLTVLDVGHGSAAVLRDEGGVVVFDTGRGPHVLRHLKILGIRKVEALLLSHTDSDHIGGAATLLLDGDVRVSRVLLNPDPTKDTDAFRQLRFAIAEAERRAGTIPDPSLSTSTHLPRNGAAIEVLFPPATTALSGVGGRDVAGKRLTSNSMSAAIRVMASPAAAVLLGGDIEFACLEDWRNRGVIPRAHTLVFPHHGGSPGDGTPEKASLFAHQLAEMVRPDTVIFSMHRTKFHLPRDEVVDAVLKVVTDVRFVCTQLPERLLPAVAQHLAWSLHRDDSERGYREGSIELLFVESGVTVQFTESA
jgi:beta-lactamase superfamily II metal-dependent hydrolase